MSSNDIERKLIRSVGELLDFIKTQTNENLMNYAKDTDIGIREVEKISRIGVNFISVGSITQSAPAAKIKLEMKKV